MSEKNLLGKASSKCPESQNKKHCMHYEVTRGGCGYSEIISICCWCGLRIKEIREDEKHGKYEPQGGMYIV